MAQKEVGRREKKGEKVGREKMRGKRFGRREKLAQM